MGTWSLWETSLSRDPSDANSTREFRLKGRATRAFAKQLRASKVFGIGPQGTAGTSGFGS